MVPVNQNLDGANFFAPSLSEIKAIGFQQRNVIDASGVPLLIIAIGHFGELVTDEFQEFTRYHRSGFSWLFKKLARFSVVSGADIYEEIGDLTRISIDRFADVAWNMRQFLRDSPHSRCVLIADLSDLATFNLVEECLCNMYLWDGPGFITPPDLLLSVDITRNVGPQSARIRQISMWQEHGRQLSGNPKESPLISRAFYVSRETTTESTTQKMVFVLFCVFHEQQPLRNIDSIRNRKNIAFNFRAVQVPFKELIDLQAVELAREILVGGDFLFKLKEISSEALTRLREKPNVISAWNQIRQSNFQDAPHLFLQYLNDRSLEEKWHTLYLLSGWYGQDRKTKYGSLDAFIEKSFSWSQEINKFINTKQTSILERLQRRTTDPMIRWPSQDPIRDADVFLKAFFQEQQLNQTKKTLESRFGFAISAIDIQPYVFYIPLSSDGTERIESHLYLNNNGKVKNFEQLFIDCYSDIKYLLEEKFIQNQANINAKFLTIDINTSAFLMDVPELIPGRARDSWVLISHVTLDMSEASRQLKSAYAKGCRISEPSLAILTSIEPDVHFLNFPSSKGYGFRDTDDERLRNAVDLEKNLFGKVLHEFSASILRYLGNIRAVRVFFEAFRKGLITFDVNEGWQIEFLEEAYYEENMIPPYPKTIESLVFVFKQFCLDGHSNSMLSPDNFEVLLSQLETAMMNLEPIPQNDRWFESICLNAQGESADICFLYKKINRI